MTTPSPSPRRRGGAGKAADRQTNTANLWAHKRAGATTPALLAGVEFDRVRALIRDLPEQDQPAAWTTLTNLLRDQADRIETAGNSHSR